MDKIIIEKGGIFYEEWNSAVREIVVGKIDHTCPEIFSCWTRPVEIRDGFLFGDLIKILKEMDDGTMTLFEMLTNSNVSMFLVQDLTQIEPEDDGITLTHIEAFKYVEMEDRPNRKTHDVRVGAHGIGNKWEQGDGDSYAIEFTDWREMLHLPIKINNVGNLQTRKYVKRAKPKKMGFFDQDGKLDGELWDLGDEEIESFENVKVEVGFTFGELFEALFDELCFFSSPVQRQEKKEDLVDRCEEAKDATEWFEMREVDSEEPTE